MFMRSVSLHVCFLGMKSRVGIVLFIFCVLLIFLVRLRQKDTSTEQLHNKNTCQADPLNPNCAIQYSEGNSNNKMWSLLLTEVLHGNKYRYLVVSGDGERRMTQLEAYTLMANEVEGDGFRHSLCQVLASHPAPAYFWETTSTNRHVAATQQFEFIIVPAPGLENVRPQPRAFEEYFSEDCSFATFSNLSGDAMLVAPSPCEGRDYGHLARFIRNAQVAHSRELFMHVGKAVLNRLSDAPLWVSTSGAGIYWLHVRLDSTPKYYSFDDFRAPPPPSTIL